MCNWGETGYFVNVKNKNAHYYGNEKDHHISLDNNSLLIISSIYRHSNIFLVDII